MNSQNGSPATSLSTLDGVLLLVLGAGMAAAAIAGRREAAYACVAAAAVWLVARLLVRPAPVATPCEPATQAPAPAPAHRSTLAHLRWALDATPVGYRVGFAGLAIALAGLAGDIAWHAGAGTEEGIARILAPFHLLLFAGAGLLLLGPVRAMWASPEYTGRLSARQALPLVAALTLITALALFVFQWLSAFGDWSPHPDALTLTPAELADPTIAQSLQMIVIAAIVITDLILVGPALLILRRFSLPFGSFTVMFTVAAALTAAVRDFTLAGSVLAAAAAGLVADLVATHLRASDERVSTWRMLGGLTSLAFAGVYLIALSVLHDRALPLDLEFGTIVLTGLAGLVLSVIAVPPTAPGAALPAATEVVSALDGEPADEEPVRVRRRVTDAADARLAAKVVGPKAARECPVAATTLCCLLRGATPKEVRAAFDPPLAAADLDELRSDVARRHDAWATEALDGLDLVYLFLEAVPFPAAGGDLLGAWGIGRRGKRTLLGLRAGSAGAPADWDALADDLVRRGADAPALIVSDGAPGVWRALGDLWPGVATQLCVRHALDEACEGLEDGQRRALRSGFEAVLDAARSSADARLALASIVEDFRAAAPAQMTALGRRLDRLSTHLGYPVEHRATLRTSTLLRRALAMLATGSRPVADTPALAWAVLELGTDSTRRLPMPLHAAAQLDQLRRRETLTHDAPGVPEA